MLTSTYDRLTAATGDILTTTGLSAFQIPLGTRGTPALTDKQVPSDLGKGNEIPLRIQPLGTFAGGTSVTITVETDSAAAMNATPTVHWTSGVITTAVLNAMVAAKESFNIKFVPKGAAEEYLGLRYTIDGTYTGDLGKIFGAIVQDHQEGFGG